MINYTDAQVDFLEGFQYVQWRVKQGYTVAQALDLAAAPMKRRDVSVDELFSGKPIHKAPRSEAFIDGAMAARKFYGSAPKRDAALVAKNIKNEVESAVDTARLGFRMTKYPNQ